MPTRYNPYYFDPALGRATQSIAALFAPPSPGDVANIVQAETVRNKDRRAQTAFDAITAPGAGQDVVDRYGIAGGLFAPTQSFFAQGQNDATARRGDDLRLAGTKYSANASAGAARYGADRSAAAAIEAARLRAEADLRGGQLDNFTDVLVNGLLKPVGADEVRPGLDDGTAAALNSALGVSLPAQASVAGPRTPLSETQARGRLITDARDNGLVDDNLLRALAFGDTPVENVVTPEGPRIATRAAAVGQEPFVNPGGRAAAEALQYLTPDGRTGTAVFDPNAQTLKDAATGQPLPEGTRTGRIEGGDATAAGLAPTTSNRTEAVRTLAEVDFGLKRAQDFRRLLEQNPGIAGIPGRVRGFAQDVAAGAAEFSQAFGSIQNVEEVRALATQLAQRNGYDPAIAQAAAMALEMAYYDAKAQDPSGEVNVRELERLLANYDGGIAGNARVLANLDVLESRLRDRRNIFATTLAEPGALGAPPPAGPPPPPRPGDVVDGFTFLGGNPADPNSWRAP